MPPLGGQRVPTKRYTAPMSFNGWPEFSPERVPAPENPYTYLGVLKGADTEDIRKAYRKLVKELHPEHAV